MDEQALQELMTSLGALKVGHYLRTSGRHSDTYVQPAWLFQTARMAKEVVAPLAKHFEGFGAQLVLGAALGGVLAGYEVSRALNLPYIFSERKDGAMTLRRGFTITPGCKVLLVEDEVQTGTSVREMTEIVRALGGEVVGIGCIVDKSGGKLHFDAPFKALLSVKVTHYSQRDCPMCKDGVEMEPSP